MAAVMSDKNIQKGGAVRGHGEKSNPEGPLHFHNFHHIRKSDIKLYER